MSQSDEKEKYMNSVFFCFSIDESIYNKDNFSLNCSKLDFESYRENNNDLTILRVFSKDSIFHSILSGFATVFRFKITYKASTQTNSFYYQSKEFTVEKGKIKFEFNAGRSGKINTRFFKDPSCLQQYTSFMYFNSIQDILFSDTLNYLKNNLDIFLFIDLLKNKDGQEKEELIKIFNNFPNYNIQFDDNNFNQNFDFKTLSIPQGTCKKLKIIFSVIKDSPDILDESYEGCIDLISNYNEYHKELPIPIKKNIFDFLISKLAKKEEIKKVCHNCETVPLLFDYLSSINSDKIVGLTFGDMPNNKELRDQNIFIELIDKYENIKNYFQENEILKIWGYYIDYYTNRSNIKDLEIIKNKLISINKNFYEKNIDYISTVISNKGKVRIRNKTLKGFDMYDFINKYNSYGNFLSDPDLLTNIAENINLNELEKNGGNILEEFNKCKFFLRIKEEFINNYIKGILSQINNYEDLSLFFKFIYKLKTKNDEYNNKDIKTANLLISHFIILLNRINNKNSIEQFKDLFRKILLLSLMYIKQDKHNNYKDIINSLNNNYSPEKILKFFINEFINSDDITTDYISNDLKKKVSEFIIKKFLLNLRNLEEKIFYTFEIKSLDFFEDFIFKEFPKIIFNDLLENEFKDSFTYLKIFIEKNIFSKEDIININYFKEFKESCKNILERLEKKEINFSDVKKLNELINNKKLNARIKYLCLGDSTKSEILENNIKTYIDEYNKYYSKLEILISYYNHYFPKSKENDIQKYKKVRQNFKEAKENICNININENIYEEIKSFEDYEKSHFFEFIYNDIDTNSKDENNEKNREVYKFDKSIELLNLCKNLFNGEKLEISFLEKPLSKFNDEKKELLEEIKYLKNYFKQNEADENIINEKLLFYKQRNNISLSIQSLIIIIQKFEIQNSFNFISKLYQILDSINRIKYFEEITEIISQLKALDNNILEKNFRDILILFHQNPKLLEFLSLQKLSDTKDLIDGIYDDENQENMSILTIEINDIDILINAVSFIQDIKNKIENIDEFLKNFHTLLNENNELYKEIASNLDHVNTKISDFKEYIQIQYGKKYKYSSNIEKIMQEGIIEFEKVEKTFSFDMLDMLLLFQGKTPLNLKEIKDDKKEYEFKAKITIKEKIQDFSEFKDIIDKLKSKKIFSYGKNAELFQKAKKLVLIISAILKELNLNKKEEFNNRYVISNLNFENKAVLRIPELEEVLNNLRKKNYEIKQKNLELIGNNPLYQFMANFDLYDFDEIKNQLKIDNYFPSITKDDNNEANEIQKLLFDRIICDDCKMNPIIGKRYKCKICSNFYYCEKCKEKNKESHKHEFVKYEENEVDAIPEPLLIFYEITRIKDEFNNLKGLFFFKSTSKYYELDILTIFNKLIIDFPNKNNEYPSSFYKKLPFDFNLLLCQNYCSESNIYTFFSRAINCISNNLFIIVRPEELEIRIEKFFFKTFNLLLEKKDYKINSCIIILYINQNSHIIKKLKNIKAKFGGSEDQPVFKIIDNNQLGKLEDLPIEVVTSDSPRVGKSTYISTKSKGALRYIIPLGDIDGEFINIYSRALKKDKDKKKVIVFELYENTDEATYNFIRNLLFKFLILKNYGSFNFISQNINIFIEVSSDYIYFEEDYKILKLFKRKHIELRGQKDFYAKNKILFDRDNITMNFCVLMYLQLLKEKKIDKTNIDQNLLKNITSINIETILKDYNSLIQKYFLDKFPSKNILPNYGQIDMFITLLGDLIYNLDECKDMHPTILSKNNTRLKELNNIREKIMNSYVDFVVNFSSLSYETILENQEIASKNQKSIGFKLTEENKKKLIEKLNKKRIITYEEIKPSIILFNKVPQDELELAKCSIITTYKKGDEEYEQLNVLYDKYLKEGELLSLPELGKPQFKKELRSICLTPSSKTLYLEQKLRGYEFTIDNFVKMILIYLRIRAKVPIILMGETGCGKTSLIEALSAFLEGKYKLLKLNIHSGFTYHDIMFFLEKNHLFDGELFPFLFNENLGKKDEKIILFLDEINTTNSLNLLSDLFTRHSFLSTPLKDNVYIMAACNPYRLLLSKNEDIGYTNKKMHNIRNLVYTVNPLPLSLINYVFDFGNLRDSDEKVYIHSFIDSFLNTIFSTDDHVNYTNILEKICDLVNYSHNYIRINNEISSVSLREIKRFKIFFGFFLDIIKRRKDIENNYKKHISKITYFVKNISEKQKIDNIIYLKAANLGIFLCYYLRIIDPEKRVELSNKLSEMFEFDFLEYPLLLEKELAEEVIKDKKGIAKNRALLDNLFTIFVCLNKKIPIFICGKAGCSKSLSFSLLYQSMNGEYSKSELLKKYPKIFLTSYQGSLTSSSVEIKKIFNRAKKIAEYKNGKKGNMRSESLSVILFDEMGLAEISPNNPLKVIHSELDNNNEIGFVGISNWTLDASKMNRGIHLSIPEPDLNDLKETSKTIANSIYEGIETKVEYKEVIDNLTKSYHDYKNHLKLKYPLSYDFHGARDFYYLIKIAANLLKNNNNNKTLENIAMESIERNFGGLELDREDNINWSSTKKFKKIFSENQNDNTENIDKYDVFTCIQKNLKEENNRYLLLITDKTKNDTLIEYILKKLNLNYRFIQGSKLKEDRNEQYILQKAWSIILSMEKGEIIIIKDMEMVYPKFYDLFNQNLQKYGNSSYARIVLDSTTNERHIVNKSFRCIILLEKDEVNEQDPPFLNRFEKHLMSFRYLLSEKQIIIAKELYEEIKELTTLPENKGISPLLVNINNEEINCLVFELSMRVDDIEKNLNQIYKLIIPTFTQENILNAVFSTQEKFIKKEDIIKIYEENTHTNIYKFLEKVIKNKLIIYTFSPYYKDIFSENNNIQIVNPIFGTFCKDSTKEMVFNDNLSEKIINYFFQVYYEDKNSNLFIIHFRVRDTKYLKYIKFQLDDFHLKTEENKKKIFLFIIHIEKNYESKNNNAQNDNPNKSVEYLEKYHSFLFSFLSEYQQITIDNLLEQRNISIINLYNKTNEELLIMKELFDINSIIKKEFILQITQMPSNQPIDILIEKLDNLVENGILECIIKKIQNKIKNSDNLLKKNLIDYSSLKEKDFDFISYFVEKIELLISDNVKKLINELGKSGYLVSSIFEKEIPKNIKDTIISFIEHLNLVESKFNDNIENYLIDLKIPGSRLFIQKLLNLLKNCKIDYINKENEYRKKKKKDDKNKSNKTLEDVHAEKKQYLKNRLWNEELLTDSIFNDYSKEILQDMFYLLFYGKDKDSIINKKQEDFLLFLYEKRRNLNDSLKDNFLSFFLWIGSNKETISKILEIIIKFDKYFITDTNNQSFLECLKDIYNTIPFPGDKDKEKVNGIFYKISESICYMITNVKNVNIHDLKLFCSDLNEVYQIFSQFNSILSLTLRTYYSINSIVKLIEYKLKHNEINENDFKEQLITFIKNIFEEQQFLSKEKKDFENAKKAFIEQIKVVMSFSDKLSMKIFVNKYLQYSKYEEYKIELVKLIFNYPKLIKYSSLFFNYIFLTQPIKPKKQSKSQITEKEKESNLQGFGEIKNKIGDKILKEINEKASNNEVLKEILIYIFELRFLSYFDDCQKLKYIQNSPKELLMGLNFEYFKNAYNCINSQDYGKLKKLGMIFYFSFIRCYLTHLIKLQLETLDQKKDLGDLNNINKYFFDISNTPLGKMIILYMANIFIIMNKKEYFLNDYLHDEKQYNWRELITSQNKKNLIFPILNYENSKHLLFLFWSKNNNNNLTSDFVKNLEIVDLYYLNNLSYNEMSTKMNDDDGTLVQSVILSKLNELKNNFCFDINTNSKLQKLFEKISNLDFFNDPSIKSNLKLIFFMINLYIIGFIGNKNNSLFSLIFSDNISFLIKIMNLNDYKAQIPFIESYYKAKIFLEEKYVKNKIFLPAYICSCGKWYYIENSLPIEEKKCVCGEKIGGVNEKLVERRNHFALYYDENQKNHLESGKENKNNGVYQNSGKLLEDFKKQFILDPLLNKFSNLNSILLNDRTVINKDTINKLFAKFIFLSNYYIEYKIGIINEEEKNKEFGNIDILNAIKDINEKIKNYVENKNKNYDEFMNYFCDVYCTLLKNIDCVKTKDVFYNYIKNNIDKEYEDQTFFNIETNILTELTYDENFKNENLKYLLTATKYPNINELKKYIKEIFKTKQKPLPILKAFIFNEKNNKEINKLQYIETINDFINTFAEMNWNLISRQKSENEEIKSYLNIKEENDKEKSPLELQFENFKNAYNEITHVEPFNLTSDQPVQIILNDDKTKTQIYKIYEHLIDIQNKFLKKAIEEYEKLKDNEKQDIIIKNAIEQIKKEIKIQQATKTEIFSFDVKSNIILSFEELFSFYSVKNIFDKKNDKIDYSKYSNLKFKLGMIEKELISIILTGKKLFSKEQMTYKFYLDPNEKEEKTKKFEKFNELYDTEQLTEEDKKILAKQIEDDSNLKKIFLQNLEILISYLIKENKYQGRQSIADIKFHTNLYLNQTFILIFKNFNNLTINKLIPIYEYMEELLWKFIANRYINKEYIGSGFVSKYQNKIDDFIENENKRELKNEMLISLLIKFICRYLPNANKEMKDKDLFGTLQEKNSNLSQGIQNELINLKKELGAGVIYANELTDYLVGRVRRNKETHKDTEMNKNFNKDIQRDNLGGDQGNDDNDDANNDDDDDRDL